ncbi:MAG TPA: tRNA (adenosine(37)-N6)-threonylcarbamoyltransferase complex ATPase subunit type 1 TsaE [Puia sp.]|jgi:tRNA threonylcarbamoyladenosine biosynthesis protein TsaE|nr:tRNA (adenosine(37)-N6)-threonylcarbamoyltransferase complex ATPase subunit type 1 TsaE [Puia sp.]
MELTFKLEGINEAAKKFWLFVGDKKVFAFYGSMGSGKTTFIHALCDEKKVSSHVGSPTFSIINQYAYSGGKIFHIDLYRLKDEEEAIRAGIEDCIYSGEICFIEWAEKAENLFPGDVAKVFIEVVDENVRHVLINSQ